MHRGASNSDYQRAPLPGPYGPPARPPFSGPFNQPQFRPPYRGPIVPPSYTTPVRLPSAHPYGSGPGGESLGAMGTRDPFYEVAPFQQSQSSGGWTVQQTDPQNLEVMKKAEEFLRILEAQDQLELSSESVPRRHGDDGDSHLSKSRPRSRSRGRSRGRSRARSRGRSRARSRSRSRGKSRTRAKSRARSRSRSSSRSRGKSSVRSKSQPRLDSSHRAKEPSRSCSGVNLPVGDMTDLFQGLKQVLQSSELEKHLSVAKHALSKSQTQHEVRASPESQPAANIQTFQHFLQNVKPQETLPAFGKNTLLPHEWLREDFNSFPRILSWNDPSRQAEVQSALPVIEDEEEFLYGEEEGKTKPQAVTVPLAHSRPTQSPMETLVFSTESAYLAKTFADVSSNEHDQTLLNATGRQGSATDTTTVTPDECEKVKNMLKTIGLTLGMADICKMAARLKQKQAEHKGTATISGLAQFKPILEALQALSKGAKSDDSRSIRSGSSHSQREHDQNIKRSEEKEKREKQIQMKRKEYLVKELEELMKQEGSGDLIPVIGFFCQRCEEFFGDLNTAKRHTACHKRNKEKNPSQHLLKSEDFHDCHKDPKKHGSQPQKPYQDDWERERQEVDKRSTAVPRTSQDYRERSPEKKRVKEERSTPVSSSSYRPDDKDKGAELSKSEKKKKKKEKKMKKKEKKKEKKEKKKKEKENEKGGAK